MIQSAGRRPFHYDVKLQVGNLQCRATHERPVTEFALYLAAPGHYFVGTQRLAGHSLLLEIGDTQCGRNPMAKILDGTHKRLLSSGIEIIDRMKLMLAPDEYKDGV